MSWLSQIFHAADRLRYYLDLIEMVKRAIDGAIIDLETGADPHKVAARLRAVRDQLE